MGCINVNLSSRNYIYKLIYNNEAIHGVKKRPALNINYPLFLHPHVSNASKNKSVKIDDEMKESNEQLFIII